MIRIGLSGNSKDNTGLPAAIQKHPHFTLTVIREPLPDCKDIPVEPNVEAWTELIDAILFSGFQPASDDDVTWAFRHGKTVIFSSFLLYTSSFLQQVIRQQKEARVTCLIGHPLLTHPLWPLLKPRSPLPRIIQIRHTNMGLGLQTPETELIPDLMWLHTLLPQEIKQQRLTCIGHPVSQYLSVLLRLETTDGSTGHLLLTQFDLDEVWDISLHEPNYIMQADVLNPKLRFRQHGGEIVMQTPGQKDSSLQGWLDELYQHIYSQQEQEFGLQKAVQTLDSCHQIIKKLNSFRYD